MQRLLAKNPKTRIPLSQVHTHPWILRETVEFTATPIDSNEALAAVTASKGQSPWRKRWEGFKNWKTKGRLLTEGEPSSNSTLRRPFTSRFR